MSHLFRYASYFLNDDDDNVYFMYKVGYREGLKTVFSIKSTMSRKKLAIEENSTFLFVFTFLPEKEVGFANIIY